MVSTNSALNSIDFSVLDKNSEYLGISTLQLMENAGRSVADAIAARFGRGTSVVVYAGTGRNGGDGMVAARHLAARGFRVNLKLIGDERLVRDSSALSNWLALKAMSSSVKIEIYHDSISLPRSESDVLVDAILGTGVKGALRQPSIRAVQVVNSSAGFKVAVDVPTGINSDTGEVLGEAVCANLTVTFHASKSGFHKAQQYCGEVIVADIGIPPEADLYAGPGDVELVSIHRPTEAHKGAYGRLLVIGGSEFYSGAPTLVALAACRTGTDLVSVAAPESVAQSIAGFSPSIITIKLPGRNLTSSHIRLLSDHIEKASTIAIGPGLGLTRETAAASRKIVEISTKLKKPLLIDADALKAVGVVKKRFLNGSVVVTPHAGEFESISGKSPSRDLKRRIEEVTLFASESGSITVLKGHTDIISDGDHVKLNNTGNPGMTVGGTGDVLSGIIAGLMAQGTDPYRAAVAGAFVNGAAGDFAAEEFGHRLTPTDLIEHIPKLLNEPMRHKRIRDNRIV
jgi:NAD(P)H-hydrate epimerase